MGRQASRSRFGFALFLCVSCACLVDATVVCGIGRIRWQSPLERTTGLYGATARALVEKPGRGISVETGQRFLFDIPGLATSSIRVGIARRSANVSLSSVVLSSPVGNEFSVSLTPVVAYESFALGGSLRYDGLNLGPLGASLLTVGVQGLAALNKTVQIGLAIDGVRILGTNYPGADIAVYFIRRGRVNAVARCELSRRGYVDASIASWARLGALTVSAGYEGSTAALRGALSVRVRAVGVSAGASAHPILGVTKSIFVRWGR